MSDLLPPNAKAPERALSLAIERAAGMDVPIRSVWNPDDCPAGLLPWLAWAFSVDEWDSSWTELQKRETIKASVSVHKKKGTIGAVRTALSALGYPAEVVEWFNMDPVGDPYTFNIDISADQEGFDLAGIMKILSVVNQTKNLRSHLATIQPSVLTRAGPSIAGVTMLGTEITVEYDGQIT